MEQGKFIVLYGINFGHSFCSQYLWAVIYKMFKPWINYWHIIQIFTNRDV